MSVLCYGSRSIYREGGEKDSHLNYQGNIFHILCTTYQTSLALSIWKSCLDEVELHRWGD